MATTSKRSMTNKNVASSNTEPAKEETLVVKQKHQYSYDDMIPCTSNTAGEYLFEGDKSKIVYSWKDAGVTEEMRYDDLTSAIRTRKPCIFRPRIVINDEELLESYPELQRLYESMYSRDDLLQILELPAKKMIDVINQLPDGAKDAIRSMAVNAIESGQLDSVARVRALDQYFGTDMLLKLAQ